MPPPRIAIDGLWRCLCPSIDSVASSYVRSSFKTKVQRPVTRSAQSQCHIPKLSRSLQTSTASPPKIAPQTAKPITASEEHSNLDNAELHEKLRHLRNKEGAFNEVAELVRLLLDERAEEPKLLHFDALIRTHADAARGSAEIVGRLLKEVEQRGLGVDEELLHSSLLSLAIHPDYLLRSEILSQMRERWFNLTSEGWHNLAVGLLRDRQYEIALDKLGEMQEQAIKIQPWLYDIFIYVLCDAEELDEALSLLKYRVDNGELNISANVWHYMLDVCSRNLNYDGTLYVWRKRVETSYINPSDGVCANVLNTAARHGDTLLAMDVARVLNSRNTKFDIYHYEDLLNAYVNVSDPKTALRVLCIMKNAGLEPTQGTTRPIYVFLCGNRDRPSLASQILEDFHQNGLEIPTAAMNVVLEGAIAHGNLQEAIEQYNSLHKICASGPNTATFNALLQGCSRAPDGKERAMLLATEMATLGVRPDLLTYDRLIIVCMKESGEDFEDAFSYLKEMRETFTGARLRAGTWTAFVQRCIELKDERTWVLLDYMDTAGHPTARLRGLAESSFGPRAIASGEETSSDKNRAAGES